MHAEREIRLWDRDLNLQLMLRPGVAAADWPDLVQVLSGPAAASQPMSDFAAVVRCLIAPRPYV